MATEYINFTDVDGNSRPIAVYSQDSGDYTLAVGTIDQNTGLQVVESRLTKKIHDGKAYKSYYDTGVLTTSGTTIGILFSLPATTKIHWNIVAHSNGQAQVRMYDGVAASSDGIAMTPYNRNRMSTNTSDIGVFHTPTITSMGTTVPGTWFIGASGFKTDTGGDAVSNKLVLKKGTKYLIVAETKAADVTLSIGASWYECDC